MVAYDRGASNTGINTPNHPSYFKTLAYSNLLEDHCKFTVIMPWYNDITPGLMPQSDAAKHFFARRYGFASPLGIAKNTRWGRRLVSAASDSPGTLQAWPC